MVGFFYAPGLAYHFSLHLRSSKLAGYNNSCLVPLN